MAIYRSVLRVGLVFAVGCMSVLPGTAQVATQTGSLQPAAAAGSTVVTKEADSAATGETTAVQRGAVTATVKECQPLRLGLALGGGGTRGLAHVTVLKVLEEAGIKPYCIAGTSMGAIVGGLYASGKTPDQIEQIFFHKKFVHSYNTVPISARVALVPLFFLPHLYLGCFGYHPYDGLYRGNKFASYMDECVGETNRKIENFKIPFAAVAANLVTGAPVSITHGDIGKAMQASSAIPELRRPVFIDDALLVDGGVNANLPVEQCKALGANFIIAVNVDEELVKIPDHHFRKIGTVPYRCLNMHLAKVDEESVRQADFVIHPDVNGIELLSNKPRDLRAALVQGDKAARAALPAIQQLIDQKLCTTKGEVPQ